MPRAMEDKDDICEQPFPSPEDLRTHSGKVIAYADSGEVKISVPTWNDLPEDIDESLTLMYVIPHGVAIVGSNHG